MAKPQNCIPVSEAKTMYTNWQQSRAPKLVRDSNPEVSDVIFTLAELEEFIEYVKDGSADAEIADPGIRIYFAATGQDSKSKATVFLAPTIGINANSPNNYNLEPLNRGTTGWPPNDYDN